MHGKPWDVVAIKSSKYVFRMLDAARELKKSGIAVAADVDALHAAAKLALDVRQGADGALPQAVVIAKLAEVGLSSTADLERVLAGIAADANVAFRSSTPG